MDQVNTPPAAVILGAGGGIGAELARRLVKQGWSLLLCGRSEESLARLGEQLCCPHLVVDARDLNAVEAAFDFAQSSFGHVDGAANCIGSLLLKPAHLTSAAEWNDTIATNVTTAFATVRGAVKAMRGTGGSVVLVSSAAAELGLPSHEAIAAAKAAVAGLTRSAAATYAAAGIRINAVAPGLVQTKLIERIFNNPNAAAASLDLHAIGRLGQPADVAAAMAWLLDPENSWITGEVISIDGGLAHLRTPTRRKPDQQ